MENYSCSLEGKSFQNFLNLVTKKIFYGDLSSSNAIQSLYGNIDIDPTVVTFEISTTEEVFCAL